jgi:hypothetical protein
MRVRLFQQPFTSTGALSRLGVALAERLMSGDYNRVHIFSAFVTSSGTRRLGPALRTVTTSGGTITALIGVDNGLTSIQAVEDLHAAAAEVLGLHTGGSILYHPKVYLLSGGNVGWISVGSSNLTGEGMYRNIETNTVIELDLALADDAALLREALAWFEHFRAGYRENVIRIRPGLVQELVASGALVNELERAREIRVAARAARGAPNRARANGPPRIPVPALPAIGQSPVRRVRRGHARVQEEVSAAAPNIQTRFFAMVLSEHDASKKTGRPGTPELSLPRAAREFFPRMRVAEHEYPDAYFEVRLNHERRATIVTYRIWERPGGHGAGHADLRINIKHETVDLTTDGGGDIVLFEASPEEGPAYEVWIVRPGDPNYDSIRARCTHTVTARGAGAAKQYGFF